MQHRHLGTLPALPPFQLGGLLRQNPSLPQVGQYTPAEDPSDRIRLDRPPRLKVAYEERDGEAHLTLTGPVAYTAIANAYRRTLLAEIPVWAWHTSEIVVDREGTQTRYNYDQIRNQISWLPPPYEISNAFDVEDPHLYLPNDTLRALYSGYTRDRQPDEPTQPDLGHKILSQVEASCRVINHNSSVRYVTTHDLQLKIDGQTSDNYTRYPPVALIDLGPGERLTWHARATLGISRMSAIYSAVCAVRHLEIEGGYEVVWETLRQHSLRETARKAAIILRRKTEILLEYLTSESEPVEKVQVSEYRLVLYEEDDTLAGAVACILASARGVEAASYIRPHLAVRTVEIGWRVEEGIEGLEVMQDVLRYLIQLWTLVEAGVRD